jgi:hypothetical protein
MSLLGIEVGGNPRTLPNFNRTTFDNLTCLSTPRITKEFLGHHTDAEGGS